MRLMDDHLRKEWAKIQASHKELVAEHDGLEEAQAQGLGPAGSSAHREFLDKLKAHLEALRKHREIVRVYHASLDASHKSNSPRKHGFDR
jgi:hypothetical protein